MNPMKKAKVPKRATTEIRFAISVEERAMIDMAIAPLGGKRATFARKATLAAAERAIGERS